MPKDLAIRRTMAWEPSPEATVATRRMTGTIHLPSGGRQPGATPSSEPLGSMTGGIPSEAMRQAYRDITRGLQDTGRGAEAGRVYTKLKG